MDKEELKRHKARFLELLRGTGIDDMDYFIAQLEKSGFFEAPASMKNHLCFEGGLMLHSLNVYEAAMMLKQTFIKERPDIFEKISDESITIAALLHDVCKANQYFRKRGAQVDFGKAEFGTDYSALPIGHGEKSVVMLFQMGLGLEDSEVCAIRWHMGAWSIDRCSSEETGNYRKAEELFPLVTLIQMADTAAAKFTERKYLGS
ncbi:MAG TPA: HD family phosphohydrolase [Porphyromonadaceae bacterium]|mgnify:FL=1|nr:HD family phosphohydrolase [Porphyromonadaceae bacterium]